MYGRRSFSKSADSPTWNWMKRPRASSISAMGPFSLPSSGPSGVLGVGVSSFALSAAPSIALSMSLPPACTAVGAAGLAACLGAGFGGAW